MDAAAHHPGGHQHGAVRSKRRKRGFGIDRRIFFLLEAQRVLPPGFLFKIILPVLLVVIGLSIIFGGHRHDNDSDRSHVNRDIKMDFDKKPYYDAVFQPQFGLKTPPRDLIGGGVSSVFGKMDLDMRGGGEAHPRHGFRSERDMRKSDSGRAP